VPIVVARELVLYPASSHRDPASRRNRGNAGRLFAGPRV